MHQVIFECDREYDETMNKTANGTKYKTLNHSNFRISATNFRNFLETDLNAMPY